MGELRVVQVSADLAEACEALELTCFPHADPAELISQGDVRAYAEVFPEGFFVVLDGEEVVGQGAGILVDFDFEHPQHGILEVVGENYCGNHRADGAWYYGTDIAVHPAHRRRGIGRMLYELRKDLVRRLGRKGIVAGGHMPGFEHYKAKMSADEYIRRVVAGEIHDSTLSFQLDNGFEAICALEDYLKDPSTDSWAALIVWRNGGG